jgi:tripartite-type tricarboxylate transporter receptor subunit TctC
MKIRRRKFLHLAVGTASLPAMSRLVAAHAYPSRPITIIVTYPAGSPTDAGPFRNEGMGPCFINSRSL